MAGWPACQLFSCENGPRLWTIREPLCDLGASVLCSYLSLKYLMVSAVVTRLPDDVRMDTRWDDSIESQPKP